MIAVVDAAGGAVAVEMLSLLLVLSLPQERLLPFPLLQILSLLHEMLPLLLEMLLLFPFCRCFRCCCNAATATGDAADEFTAAMESDNAWASTAILTG